MFFSPGVSTGDFYVFSRGFHGFFSRISTGDLMVIKMDICLSDSAG